MMKKIFLLSIIGLMGILHGCNEEPVGQPPTDKNAPGIPTNIEIQNIAGGAIITYTLPLDEDLLYVEAQFDMKGETRNVKASCFENRLIIEGYADTNEHNVDLYCVDRSNNYSEPVNVKIQPEETPVMLISKTVEMTKDIGGIQVIWMNETKAAINLMLYAADENGELQLADVVYTSMSEGMYYLRGYDDQERRFGVVIKDRWDNYSDTISGYYTPRFEQEIPKSGINKIQMTEDNNTSLGNWDFGKMFDNVETGDNNGWHARTASTDPEHGCYFTIDLGHKVKLTRYKLWQRGDGWYYTHHNPKVWEIYSRTEDPKLIYSTHYENDTDYWAQGFRTDTENWYQLPTNRTEKPSGFDNPTITAEDLEYAAGGHEFIFPEDMPEVRYLRFTIDQTWAGGTRPTLVHICELSFFGKIVDDEE